MISHIDIVEPDFQKGCQVRVANLSIAGGRYDLVSADPARWVRVLGLEAAPALADDASVRQFLERVAARLRGDYLFATEPHEAGNCPFVNGDSVPMAAVPVPQAAPASAI